MPGNATDDKPDLRSGIPVAAFADKPMLAGKVGTDDVLLVRSASGFFATGATCTHAGAPLDQGVLVGDVIRCPWHHACFHTPTGQALAAPAFASLTRWAVEERDGRVYVRERDNTAISPVEPAEGNGSIVIIGAGAGGAAAADTLARFGAGHRTILIGNESEPPYDRTALSKHFLAGALKADSLPLDLVDLARAGVGLRLGSTVVEIDPHAKRLRLADDTTLPFDKLILATGAEPRRLDVPGAELPHVFTLRSARDARDILARLPETSSVVVIGSSFVGLEAAAALRDQDLAVTVVSPEDHPFAKTLGPGLSKAIMAKHRSKGTAFRLGRQVRRIEPHAVELDDGTQIEADLVIVGIGVSPRLALAERAALTIDRGVVVDERLRSSHHDIYAVGDIARWPDPHSGEAIRVEHWAVAQRQGQIAALNALGHGLRYDVVPFFWTMHFDLSVRYVGHATDWDEIETTGDPATGEATLQFRKGGRDLAIATMERDRDSLAAELTMERRLGQAAAALPVITAG